MLNVLHITHDLEYGGLQQVIANLCRSVNKTKFSLSVLSISGRGPLAQFLEEEGIPFECLNIQAPDYMTVLKIARYLKKQKLDVIHTHNTQPLIEGGLAALVTKPRVPIIHTDHSRIFPVRSRYLVAERAMSWHVKKVIAVSRSTASDLINKVGIASSKIQVIPNGIEIKRFECATKDFSGIREVIIGEKIIGYVGRLVEGKGIQYLLHAMKSLIVDGMKVRLVIVGYGDYENELRELAIHLRIDEKVEFVGPRADVEKVYQAFDVFVLPSLSEGLPVVLLEAMAAGCPVIASDVGGVAEIIENGVSGLIVQPRNHVDLACKLKQVLCDEGYRELLAATAREKVRSKFSLRAMATCYELLYSSYA
jgi:glycosyltransferase involved in cell wall biosynthesis